MHVVATAGHVDHGKSSLVEVLTGQDPDRLDEERERGLTIELGYAWTTLPGVGEVAFVDVPGHQRFVTTMLAGVGPVPAVLLVVAADDPWMPQAEEHVAALDALGVRHWVVAVTRSDLADPAPMVEEVHRRLGARGLSAAVMPVSSQTREGIPALQQALAAMCAELPEPDPDAPARLWCDRVFSLRGAGTVVTGTLPAGTVRVGDELAVGERRVRVRGLQSLETDRTEVAGTARVAVRAGGDVRLRRGDVLVTPGSFTFSTEVDVALSSPGDRMPERPVLHVGATHLEVHARPLGERHARLRLPHPLPWHVGDRVLLRDPGRREVWGAQVLDPAPSPLRRRGAAAQRGKQLSGVGVPTASDLLAWHGPMRAGDLLRLGLALPEGRETVAQQGDWWVPREWAAAQAARLTGLCEAHERDRPVEPGLTLEGAARALGLPSAQLVPPLVRDPWQVRDGRIVRADAGVPPAVLRAVEALRAELADAPFAAPAAGRLPELGLDRRTTAAADKAGLLLVLEPGVVLLAGADDQAAQRLAELPQPFTTSEARAHLGTSRRVALPLLALLDRHGRTVRHPDDTRSVT
ncbi:selenocysteine-specific elongation factor [Barrientosiimonas humi]|uniref:Selenocysteine-specific elongation factor n=1 Tax=Barrientosiimonas humi TaxID=999931 RepID=A0A542XF92_9MICO|nr:selenocysteine-specific translation elongation factor [Barrientosiimonas humi]TQL34489.1 selenocysteine-specific elongation factor [Barrientosiimonas humi]CAG7574478.1 Selenocysteine-specific elongation factor [Barrientosiimonas humi]